MNKHTPGPWMVRRSPHGKRYLCVQMGRDENYTTLELEPADARLIAAAPELLFELQEILEWARVERAPLRLQEMESIARLISKATGEPS